MYKKIILPTDGSTFADEEVERATRLIADDGEIIVISVAGKITNSAFQRRRDVALVNKGLREEAEDAVNKMMSKFDDSLNVEGKVLIGFPAEEINKFADEVKADLIIITASGKSGIHKFIIGSVAEKVLETSEIDVLLIHNR